MTVLPSQYELLSGLLDASSLRHRVIAQNIANVNTPGYRRLEVSFEDKLAAQIQSGAKGGFDELRPVIEEDPSPAMRADGNNVDIDLEMGMLNKNALLYSTYVQILASKLAMMRSAITGR